MVEPRKVDAAVSLEEDVESFLPLITTRPPVRLPEFPLDGMACTASRADMFMISRRLSEIS
jgi:hypothetical protein